MQKETTIPLWALVSSVPAFIGAILWISFIAYTTEANASKIKEIQEAADKKYELLIEIRQDVALIKQQITKGK